MPTSSSDSGTRSGRWKMRGYESVEAYTWRGVAWRTVRFLATVTLPTVALCTLNAGSVLDGTHGMDWLGHIGLMVFLSASWVASMPLMDHLAERGRLCDALMCARNGEPYSEGLADRLGMPPDVLHKVYEGQYDALLLEAGLDPR